MPYRKLLLALPLIALSLACDKTINEVRSPQQAQPLHLAAAPAR